MKKEAKKESLGRTNFFIHSEENEKSSRSEQSPQNKGKNELLFYIFNDIKKDRKRTAKEEKKNTETSFLLAVVEKGRKNERKGWRNEIKT